MLNTTTPINPDESLNTLVERRPELMSALIMLGLDLCCGGGLSLRQASQAHGLLLRDVVAQLEVVAQQPRR